MKYIVYLLSFAVVGIFLNTSFSSTVIADGETKHASVTNGEGEDAGEDTEAEVSADGNQVTMNAKGLKPCVAGCKAGQDEQVTFVKKVDGSGWENKDTGESIGDVELK